MAQTIADLLDAPVVLISAVVDGAHAVIAAHGIAIEDADRVSPLYLEVVSLARPVLVQDARRHIAADARDDRGAPLVSYMGVPIARRDAACFGAISVFREENRDWHGRELVAVRGFVELVVELLAERCEQMDS